MRQIKERYGSVLGFVLIILLVMTLVVFAIAKMSTRNLSNVVGEYWEDRARLGAISGVQRVLTEVVEDPSYSSSLTDIPLDGDPEVTWSTTVENNVGGSTGFYASDNRTWVPPGAVYIHAVGKMRSLATSGVASVAALIAPQKPVFNDALFGSIGVDLDKSQTVSWYPGTFAEKRAHVATNAIADEVIKIENSSIVDGDAVSGVDPIGGTTPISKDGTSTIVGTERMAEESKLVSAFTSPVSGPPSPDILGAPHATPQMLPPGAYGPLKLDGTAVTLDGGGNYYFQNYIDLRNNARLNVVGATLENPARVYFNTSAVFYADTRVNWNDGPDEPFDPRVLQIYAVDPPPASYASEMYIHGVDKVAFVTAGNDLDVFIDGSTLHGAIIAKYISAVFSVVKYDTRLKGVPLDGTGGFKILSVVAEGKGVAPAGAPPPKPPKVAVNPPPPAPGAPPPPAPPPPKIPPIPPGPVY